MQQFPPHIWITEIDNRGERLVFDLLSKISLSNYDIALHSLNLHGNKTQQWFELDFLIVTRKAIIGIEVKGKEVITSQGRWYVVDERKEVIYSKSKSPLVQASEALDAFRTGWFKENFGHIKRLPFVKVAVLCGNHRPDYKTSTSPPEMIEALVIYKEDLYESKLKDKLNAAIDYHVTTCHKGELRELTKSEVEEIAKSIRPEIDLTYSTSSSMNSIEDQQKRLTEEQYLLSDQLSIIDRLVIDGGAGTGKTFILIYSAIQELSLGRSVVVLSRSLKLLNFIRESLPPEIKCLHIDSIDERHQERFDVVFIDEGQDLCDEISVDKIEILLDKGLQKGRWRWFGDFENQFSPTSKFNQDIYDYLVDCTGNNSVWKMKHNVRNTPNIVKWLEKVLIARVGETQVKGAGPEVSLENSAQIEQILSSKASEYGSISHVEIAILYVAESDLVSAGLTKYKSTDCVVSSIDDFKGLESRMVIVIGLGNLKDLSKLREYAYKSISRARSICLILSDENLSKELRKIRKGI